MSVAIAAGASGSGGRFDAVAPAQALDVGGEEGVPARIEALGLLSGEHLSSLFAYSQTSPKSCTITRSRNASSYSLKAKT